MPMLMQIETGIPDIPFDRIPALAARVEELGFDGIAKAELRHDPFLSLALATTSTRRAWLATSVAIAFPRSPMIVAYEGRDLQEMSGGRFVLGLGTQVKGHNERRFSTPWDSPGPRLKEYVRALRAIWDTWQNGTPLNFEGKFYTFTLMTPEFSPGPMPYPPPRVEVAAVNPYNARLAGELCDGLKVHGFATPEYIRDVLWPAVRQGAERSGRDLSGFEMVGGGFIATGATEEEVRRAREEVRYRIAFYASTRTYLPVLEHHGWEAINPALRDLIAQNAWDRLATVVPDEVVDGFCVSGTYDAIVPAVRSRYEGLVDVLSIGLPEDPWAPPPAYLTMLEGLKAIRPAAGQPTA